MPECTAVCTARGAMLLTLTEGIRFAVYNLDENIRKGDLKGGLLKCILEWEDHKSQVELTPVASQSRYRPK